VVTHTGQVFQPDDYRKVRFVDQQKLVNTRFAIDLIREDPVVICTKRVVSSDSGGPLGHPKVYINLDQPGYHICGYSGRKFVLKKHYDEKTMGPAISYSEYLKQIGREEDE
jgi:NADH dehydrogenase (ubiquinone) Fe-S protein 6